MIAGRCAIRRDRPPADEIGRSAGTRAIARLGARKIETQKAAVLFDRRVADDLIGEFLSAHFRPVGRARRQFSEGQMRDA